MTAEGIARVQHGRRCGRGWIARCPAHDDRSPSLSIIERNGRVLVHCHAGCRQAEVIAALLARGLWPEHERREWSPEKRAAWAAEQCRIERDLPAARLWRRAAVAMGEEVLDALKVGLVDPNAPIMQAEIGELERWTRQVAMWRRMDGGELVQEYAWWRQHHPRLTEGMVRAARNLGTAELRALRRYLAMTEAAA